MHTPKDKDEYNLYISFANKLLYNFILLHSKPENYHTNLCVLFSLVYCHVRVLLSDNDFSDERPPKYFPYVSYSTSEHVALCTTCKASFTNKELCKRFVVICGSLPVKHLAMP